MREWAYHVRMWAWYVLEWACHVRMWCARVCGRGACVCVLVVIDSQFMNGPKHARAHMTPYDFPGLKSPGPHIATAAFCVLIASNVMMHACRLSES